MSKRMETRAYPMADADLKQLADKLKNNVVRDATEFATRNVAAPQLASYDALITAFENKPTDVELKGMVIVAAAEKKALIALIHKQVCTIRNIAWLAYHRAGKYKVFGFENLTHLSDDDLYWLVKRVVRLGTLLQADLTRQGLVTSQLTGLADKATLLDKANDKVYEAEGQRLMQTIQRIETGNLLYREMVRLSFIEKSLFEDTDEAHYNEYVLVGSRRLRKGGSKTT